MSPWKRYEVDRTWDHKEQRKVAHLGYRKKKWGMRMNEGLWVLFIGKGPLEAKETYVIRLGHMGDDVESLGAVLERLWCKVEVDGGGFGSCGVHG
ncbi:hypothetical protein Tco_0295455 [Tanacetum coccineum]